MIEGSFHSAKGHEIVCSEDGCWSYRKRQERFGSLITALHSGIAELHILRRQCDTGCCQRHAESFQSERVAWCLNNHGSTMVSQSIALNDGDRRLQFVRNYRNECRTFFLLFAFSRNITHSENAAGWLAFA